MDQQAVFNTVAEHLLAQNEQSLNKAGECSYRGHYGRKCAVGCLITDDAYDRRMEGTSVTNQILHEICNTQQSQLLKEALYNSGVIPEGYLDIDLLHRLQEVHDDCPPHQWEDLLTVLASEFELEEFNDDT